MGAFRPATPFGWQILHALTIVRFISACWSFNRFTNFWASSRPVSRFRPTLPVSARANFRSVGVAVFQPIEQRRQVTR